MVSASAFFAMSSAASAAWCVASAPARLAVAVSSAVAEEACPLNLAPTASTTAQMALGDALAVALLDARGFGEADFARSHPGGALGRKLLVHVGELMVRGDELPTVDSDTPFTEMMRTMSAKGLGAALLVDGDGRLQGIFTDGDLRRRIEAGADLRTAVDVVIGPGAVSYTHLTLPTIYSV